MRGHIRKKGKNYYVVLELSPVDGERQQKTLSVRKELNLNRPAKWKEADSLLTVKLKELNEGKYFEPATFSLEEYIEIWMSDYVELNCKPKTIEFYRHLSEKHVIPAIGSIPLSQLKPAHIQKMVTVKSTGGRLDGKSGGLSQRTVQAMVSMIRQALDQAVRWEYTPRNAAVGVKAKTPARNKPLCWSKAEATKFLKTAKTHRLYPLYLTALTTGLRRGELLGLRWKDVDIINNKLSIKQTLVQSGAGPIFSTPKTEGSERTIDVSSKVMAVLQKWKDKQAVEFNVLEITPDHDLVFTSEAGTPLIPRNLKRSFELLSGKAKIPKIKIHALRDTYATLQLENGIHLKAVAQTLGHTNEVMLLSRYAHALPGLQKEAAVLLDELIPE